MKSVLKDFFNSEFYIITIFILSFVSWFFTIPILIPLLILLILVSVIVFTQDDSISLLPVFLGAFFANIPNTNCDYPEITNAMLAKIPVIPTIIIASIIILELIYFLFKNFQKGKHGFINIGWLLITAAVFLAGSDPSNLSWKSLQLTDGFVFLMITFISFFFSFTSKNNQSEYVAKTFLYFGILITSQILANYVANPVVHSPLLKWGTCNTAALILDLTIPISAYVMVKKVNPIHTLLWFITLAGCLGTISRGGVGVIVPSAIITTIVLFRKTQHKNLLIASYIASICIGAVLVGIKWNFFYDHIKVLMSDMFRDGELNSSGRWGSENSLFNKAIICFKENMIFGEGTEYYSGSDQIRFYHSTILDIAAKLGLVGCIAYILHFIQKYLTLLIKRTSFKTFVLIGVLTAGTYGLIDVYYFNFTCVLVLALALCFAEKSQKEI